MNRDVAKGAVQRAGAWAAGAIAIPALLVISPAVFKGATFYSAVQHGELFIIAAGVTGASMAAEYLLGDGGTVVTLYRSSLIVVLVGEVLVFGETLQVKNHMVVTVLDHQQVHWSVLLLVVSALTGILTVTRKNGNREAQT
jgi:uncharacterized membrane protein